MGRRSAIKRALLTIVGVAIGFNGVAVAVAPKRIDSTYGVVADDPDLEVLLRHRAVMLALIGSLLVAAAFRRELRNAAAVTAAVSMASFTLFALTSGANGQQRQVAVLDLVLLGLLAAALVVPEERQPTSADGSLRRE